MNDKRNDRGPARRGPTGAHGAMDVLRAVARADAGQPLLVLVGGPPASGKTAVADALAEGAGLITLHKDAFKEPLMTAFGVRSVEDSATLGRAAIIALFTAADAVLHRSAGVLLESTFNADDAARIAALLHTHGCALLQIHVTATVDVLVERWRTRAATRHPGHLDRVRLPEMRRRAEAGTWAPLTLGAPLLVIDTSAGSGDKRFDVDAWLDGLRRSQLAAARH